VVLDDHTIHVWPVRLLGSDADLAAFDRVLAPDERARAARFAVSHLRRNYMFSRGALRMLLSTYAGTPPADLSFTYGPQGKPSSPGRVRFNASHSGDHALYAFTLDSEVGVDIEGIRRIPELQQIARQFFCRAEESDLLALPPDQQEFAFARCWTRKEAYIKAKGGGLSIPLDSFRVSLRPTEDARFLVLPQTEAGVQWNLHHLEIFSAFASAVAYPGNTRRLHIFPPKNAAELTVAC
jgi:4'-phosphopantetheinyl transferase